MCGEDSTKPKFSAPPHHGFYSHLPALCINFLCTKFRNIKCKKFVAMTLQRTLRAEIPPGMCLLGWHLQLALCVYSPHCCTTASCVIFAYAWALICISWLEMCISTSLSCEDLIYESSKNKTYIQATLHMLFQAIWWGIQEDCEGMMIILYFILQGFFPQHPITTPPK